MLPQLKAPGAEFICQLLLTVDRIYSWNQGGSVTGWHDGQWSIMTTETPCWGGRQNIAPQI